MPSFDIKYGDSSNGQLHFDGEVAVVGVQQQASVTDIAVAVNTALSQPIEFPAIELAIVPGDRVVLAVDQSIPQLSDVVTQMIAYLQRHSVEHSQLVVVLAGHTAMDASQLAAQLPAGVTVEVHDADDKAKVAYVAANKEGEPIYMNRMMVDADVVIPVMCARSSQAIDYEGAYGVFPLLTDRRTRGQFYSLRQLADPSEHRRLTSWADEAAWWVGLLIAVQVIPAADGGIAHILAGDPQALEAAVQQTMQNLWQPQLKQTYDCVVALIDGGPSQQTWDNVARVLASTTPLVRNEGALIICSELAQRPGHALHQLSDTMRSDDLLAKQLSSDPADDALAAAVLFQSLENCHVYLLSQLPSEVVEALGVGPLKDLHQAEHIVQQRSNCLIVSSAQHSLPSLSQLA